MILKQLSVFVENKLGKLVDVVEALGQEGIDIRALSIADTSDFGILRVIVSGPDDVAALLREQGYIVRLTNVLAVSLPDAPGSLAKVLRALSDENINVEYTYAFVSHNEDKAYVVIKVENNEHAMQVLAKHGVLLADEEDIYK
ncbi:MAG: ACT domain-containing protein [Clostridiales bacterium]|nr:ACT domain-containing protein [Clostridiales bacterium]